MHSISSPKANNSMSQLKATLVVSLPMILGQVGQILMGVTDSIMVGHLGAAPLAASAFISNIVNIPFVFLIGLSTCISVKVSNYYGSGDSKQISESFWNGLLITLMFTVLIIVGLLLLRNDLWIFRQPEDVTAISKVYFITIIFSLLPSIIFQCSKNFCDGFSHTIPATVVMIMGLVANIVLNWIFIYGNLGAPALGLDGAGYATLAARFMMALLMTSYVFYAPVYKMFTEKIDYSKWNLKVMSTLAKIGVPSGLQFLFEVGAFAGAGVMMGWISTPALAGHQIALNLASLTFMVALGISLGSSVRVGQAHGKKNWVAVRTIGLSAMLFVLAIEIVFALMFFLAKDQLPLFYISDTAVIALASQMLLIAALFQLFDGLQCVALGLLRGLSDVKIPTSITFAAYWIIGLPLSYILAFVFKLEHLGIWIGLLVALVFSAGLLTWRFLRLTKFNLKI
jgi:multidrug resistance protein, MATE family